MRGEVHDRIDVEASEDLLEALPVARVADDQLAEQHGLPKAGRKIVEDDDALGGLAELAHDVRADIAGAARHEDRFLRHASLRNDIMKP